MAEGSSSQLKRNGDEIEDGVEQVAIEDGVDQYGRKHAAILKSVKQYCEIRVREKIAGEAGVFASVPVIKSWEEVLMGVNAKKILKATLHAFCKHEIPCAAGDKFAHILALLQNNLVRKKVLIFTNTVDMGFRLKLFLEKFAMDAHVLNPDLPQTARLHIIREFNAGSIDYLIAIYDGKADATKQEAATENAEERFKRQWKQLLDVQFGVVSGSELQDVNTVINFQMPLTAAGYMHRIGRTGRRSDTRTSFSLVSPDEMQAFKELKSTLTVYRSGEEEFIVPFRLLTKDMVNSLRYRAEDIERTVTRLHVYQAQQPHKACEESQARNVGLDL